jgi:hypothetical protein
LIEIFTPDLPTTRKLQEAQGRYYWSRAAELLFRREGVISVRRVTSVSTDCTVLLVCRDAVVKVNVQDVPRVFEGPLPGDCLTEFGLAASNCLTDTLVLDNDNLLSMHLPEVLVRNQDKTTFPLPLDGAAVKWRNTPFRVQFLAGSGWEPVVRATDPTSGMEGAIAVRRGKDLVIGFSAFDLLTRWLAVPPLAARYGGFSRVMRHDLLSERFVSLVVDHGVGAGAPHPLKIERWPKGYSSAFTVRHDYDRKADPSQIQKLLRHYDMLAVRASIGFLPYFLDKQIIEAFEGGGHEIQGHIASPSQTELREDLQRLRIVSRQPVSGVTIHGGPKGIGFRGQNHFEWFDDSGLTYCETFGIRDTIPVPICRLYEDIPDCSRMIATPGHLSLDGSTAPGDHRLDALMLSVPKSLSRGNYTIVMNHPDVHHEQLCALLSGIALDGIWCATMSEIVHWHRVTRYESLVRWMSGSYEVWFPEKLPQVATLRFGDMASDLGTETRHFLFPRTLLDSKNPHDCGV